MRIRGARACSFERTKTTTVITSPSPSWSLLGVHASLTSPARVGALASLARLPTPRKVSTAKVSLRVTPDSHIFLLFHCSAFFACWVAFAELKRTHYAVLHEKCTGADFADVCALNKQGLSGCSCFGCFDPNTEMAAIGERTSCRSNWLFFFGCYPLVLLTLIQWRSRGYPLAHVRHRPAHWPHLEACLKASFTADRSRL